MKPRSLHLQQFGPYTDHIVDFEPFTSDGLFLIHGDTGSGKSTLLDAISFALFGRGLGVRDGEDHLRNKTAPPDQVSAVTLEFTLGDARYRVRRTMAHERPSRRGGGLTRQPAEALIECASGDPSFESVTQPARVTERIERLLKLQREQFSRIIVLPQGEFRELLLATAKDRERLLEQIFGSELYKAVERALHDMDKLAEQSVLALGDRSASLLSSVGARDREGLGAMHAAAAQVVDGLQQRVGALSAVLAAQIDALEGARNVQGRNARRSALSAALGSLDARAEEMSALRREVDAAARADLCLDAVTAAARSNSLTAASSEAIRRAESDLAEAIEALNHSDLSDERRLTLEADRDRLSGLATELETKKRTIERLASEARARREVRALVAAHRSTREGALAHRAALESEGARLEGVAAALRLKVAGESVAALRRQEVSQRLESARGRALIEARRVELERACRESERRVRSAALAEKSARAARDTLRRLSRAAIAAQLAEGLSEAEPCPVCGSEAHPRPASPADAAVEQRELGAAEDALDQAAEALQRASQRHAQELGELSAAQSQLLDASAADPATELELAAMLTHAQSALSEALEARRKAEETERARAALATQWAAANQACTEAERAVTMAEAREAALTEPAEGDAQALSPEQAQRDADAARRALEAVEEQVTAWARSRAMLSARRDAARGRLAEARSEHGALTDAAARAGEALTRTLAEQGFSTVEASRDARREPSAWRAMRQRVLDHEDAVRRALSEREALGEREPEADVEALERESASTRRELDAAQQSTGGAAERCESFARLMEQVDVGGAERAEKERLLARVRRVADLANGRSEGRVRLSRYVLLDQFDRVVDAASGRLDVMSDGRFRLHRRESRTVGAEFELMVDDAYTGAAERSVATLSGGEMFLASLAMALGLSDVVQQHAGGVRIESLFVDEGFGSLDEESLDKAVMVLEQLQANHRMVGVVSHVPELRKRILSKLEVVRTDQGAVTRSNARHRSK